jgi:glycosyltransferase involved in cell wall biosynthesis
MFKKSSKYPLISIITTCKNSTSNLEDCILSILNQTYPYIEYIIQDGGSSLDKTLSILNKYKGRLKIYTKHDRIADEGLLSAYSQCSGDWIGTCLSDEVLKHNDIEKIVEVLSSGYYDNLSAIYCDCNVVDYRDGVVKRKLWRASRLFDLNSFLCRKLKIPLVSTFFNRKKFLQAGLGSYFWIYDVAENEIFIRLYLVGDIHFVQNISVGSYFVGGFNLSVSPYAIKLQKLGLERAVENIKYSRIGIPLYLRNRYLYVGMQYLYLCLKFQESGAIKESFDCFYLGLLYGPKIITSFKLLLRFWNTKYFFKATKCFANFLIK